MQGVERFFELAWLVCLGAAFFWPFTLMLAGVWVATVVGAPGGRLRPLALGCPALAFPVAILACGAAFAALPTGEESALRSSVGQTLEIALLVAHFALAVVSIWRAGEGWPVVAVSWVCAGYLSLLASFVSGMAITGVWL